MPLILDNLIFLSLMPFGFVMDNLILALKNPAGFIVVFSSITFLEFLVAKSIAKNTGLMELKPAINYIKSYRPRDVSPISPQWELLDIISKRKNISIKKASKNMGLAKTTVTKLIVHLVDEGLVVCETSENEKQTLCYVSPDK